MVLAAAAGFGAEVVQYMPSTAKKALVGSGQGTKEQVAAMAGSEVVLCDAQPAALQRGLARRGLEAGRCARALSTLAATVGA